MSFEGGLNIPNEFRRGRRRGRRRRGAGGASVEGAAEINGVRVDGNRTALLGVEEFRRGRWARKVRLPFHRLFAQAFPTFRENHITEMHPLKKCARGEREGERERGRF